MSTLQTVKHTQPIIHVYVTDSHTDPTDIVCERCRQLNQRVGWPLWNNRFTDDIGYVPYVVTTIPFPFMNVTYRIKTIYRICYNMSNTTGATRGAESAYPSGAHEIHPSFWWGSCCVFFSFLCCIMCTIVCLFFFFSFLAMTLSVYFRFMSLTVPLVSFVPFLNIPIRQSMSTLQTVKHSQQVIHVYVTDSQKYQTGNAGLRYRQSNIPNRDSWLRYRQSDIPKMQCSSKLQSKIPNR